MNDESDATLYAHPPIVEAIMELRFKNPQPKERLARLSDLAAKRYANRVANTQLEVDLNFDLRQANFKESGTVVQLSSLDQTQSLNIAPGSIAWVTRSPYEGWGSFAGRLEAEVEIALRSLKHPSIARVGLRYVNRIDVPGSADGIFRYEDYLKYRIEAGPFVEPCVNYQWMVRATVPQSSFIVLIQSAVVAPEVIGTTAFTFDIDVSAEVGAEQSAHGIMGQLNEMRVLKNKIFNDGVTSKAKALYS